MKRYFYHAGILLLTFFSFVQNAGAQLEVTGNQTGIALATALTGPGVTVSGATLNCYYTANGKFVTDTVSPIGISAGIVLTTGSAVDSVDPSFGTVYYGVANPSDDFASGGWSMPGDPDLDALSSTVTTQDACVLEFDFIPAGDSIKFNYVFGSEEYDGFTCTGFNDVFGFFITGGAYTTATNIALVPGTTIPVCINSVNCGPILAPCTDLGAGSPFCTYFIDNLDVTAVPYPYVVYAGLTTVLQAYAAVVPCETYHLKLAIGDGGDDAYDSGVFLEAGSLVSTGISISSSGLNPYDTGFGAQYCVRECTPGKFIFRSTKASPDSQVVHFTIAGTAVNGYDYTTIADSVIIPANDTTDTLYIYGLAVPPAGPKTVKLLIYSPSCSGVPHVVDSAELTIYDSLFVHINTADTAVCLGNSVFINTSGDPVLSYSWAPAATLSSSTALSPVATPVVTTTYIVTASYPSSGCLPSRAQITISVFSPPTLDVGAPVKDVCLGGSVDFNVTATPPLSSYTYAWSPATYLSSTSIPNPVATPGVVADVTYTVTVSNPAANCSSRDSFLLHVLVHDFTILSQDTTVCFSTGPFQVVATGDTQFTYQWSPTTGVSDPTILTPTISPALGTTSTYVVTASYPGCPDITHSITYDIQDPNVDIQIGDTLYCVGSPMPIPVLVTPVGAPYTFTWSPATDLSDTNNISPDFLALDNGTYTYHVTIHSAFGCVSADSITFSPRPQFNLDIAPGDITIRLGDNVQLNAVATTLVNPIYFYWQPNNGTLDNPNINDPVATPTSTTTYTVMALDQYGCRDTVSETINVDTDVPDCLPSAFSPNGDGRNDVFRWCSINHQKLIEFLVFDRWGQKVYENTTDITKGWDGTYNGVAQDMGVYNYIIIIAKPDGTDKTYTGNVTLLR